MITYIKLATKLNNWKYTTAQELLDYLELEEQQYEEAMYDGWLSDPNDDWSEPYEHYVGKVEQAHKFMVKQGTAHEYKDWDDFWNTLNCTKAHALATAKEDTNLPF